MDEFLRLAQIAAMEKDESLSVFLIDIDHEEAAQPVADFDRHVLHMIDFHRRYMISNKICRFWVNMVRQLDVEMIVPQHGARFEGKAMVNRFLAWIETLPCGIDLMTQDHYRVP